MMSLYDVLPALERWQIRLLNRVLVGDGCWGWMGHHTHDGYSRFSFGPKDRNVPLVGRDVYVHIYLYELFVGKVPEDMDLDHVCKNRGCINWEHMEPVPHVENIKRRDMLCGKGHRMSETRMVMKSGRSCCGTCYWARLDRDKAARLARGHKKKGRKPKDRSSDQVFTSGK